MTQSDFIDAFSANASQYAAARPSYPTAMFSFLAAAAPSRHCAWDCATGNGQAAQGLAHYFDLVLASDASAQQIARANPQANVRYYVSRAEHSGLADSSVDLISVAQALHWFKLEEFYAEVRRVARPQGVLAVYGYDWFYIGPELDALVERWLLRPLEAYWLPQVRALWRRYQTIPFPFEEIQPPRMAMYLNWTLPQLFSYVRTWSATATKIAAEGEHFMAKAYEALAPAWGEADRQRTVVMPLAARLGRLS